jgi:hypothetical protein
MSHSKYATISNVTRDRFGAVAYKDKNGMWDYYEPPGYEEALRDAHNDYSPGGTPWTQSLCSDRATDDDPDDDLNDDLSAGRRLSNDPSFTGHVTVTRPPTPIESSASML